MALTAKQWAYIEARASGMGPSDAYRSAYNASRMSPQAVSVEAARMEKHPSVAPALALVQEVATERVIARLEPAINSAEWIIEQAVATHREARIAEQFGPAISALALLAKRHQEFKDNVPQIDARTVVVNFPEGTSIEDKREMLRRLQGDGG
jgi:hypothetical protein